MKGVPGRTYNLEVRHDNKIYTATSKMASVVNIDSVWSIKPPIPPGGPNGAGSDSLRVVACRFQDPAEKDSYRLIAELPRRRTQFLFLIRYILSFNKTVQMGKKQNIRLEGQLFRLATP